MSLWKKFKLRPHIQLFLMFMTFSFVMLSNNVVISKTLIPIENNKPLESNISETFQVSQNFLDIDFGNDYYSKMLEADRFYKQGNLVKVKQIQREVKPDFPPAESPAAAQSDLSKLDTQGQEYWQIANQALKKDDPDEDEIFDPLENLVEDYPEFIPGHILLANTYYEFEEEDDALSTIEKASEMYPGRDDVLDTRIELLLAYDKPLEASIAAREFAYSYPDYHKTPAYKQAADEYFQQYQEKLKSKITASGLVGGAGQAATGNEAGGVAIGKMLLDGEKSTGEYLAEGVKTQSSMVSNTEQQAYINDIGQKLAKLMGRDEFTYEFNIVEDPSPNAFAYPAGKIFIHTGMLQIIDSEAELAGILAHEIAHAVLSHGYTGIADSALTSTGANVGAGILSAIGVDKDIASGVMNTGGALLTKEFSRNQEKQADVLGLRVLAAAGYSADGLYNVMAKLNQLEDESNWADSLLSSHPASEKRMRYLEELIQTKGYNRYGYEGVEAYQKVFPD